MSFLDKLIREKPKSPVEVVSRAVGAFENLISAKKEQQIGKALEAVSKYLNGMKLFLFGDEEHEPTKESVICLAAEVAKTDLLAYIVGHLEELDFETRKDAAQVFGAVVRIRDQADKSAGAQYVLKHPLIISNLFAGHDSPTIALNCGSMLRDCIRDEALAKYVMEGPFFVKFFSLVEVANFELASDAASTFKDLLTRHKAVTAQYLSDHYAEFFEAYRRLLESGNYVTRRQSLKLLGELLLDRSNVKVMVKYVSDVQHLMTMMMLLKDTSKSIQFEAFHVFKVFVANPNKPPAIVDILAHNREKLLKYLENFHADRVDDEQFKEEKAVIIKEISTLSPTPVATVPPPPAAVVAADQSVPSSGTAGIAAPTPAPDAPTNGAPVAEPEGQS